MKTKQKRLWILCGITAALVLLVAGTLIYYACHDWGFSRISSGEEAALRLKVVQTAQAWLGTSESDGGHKAILDLYNHHTPLAQDYIVKDTDEWCATFVSTVAIQTGLTHIIPTECGCQRQIGLFEDLGRWEEDDRYSPLPGDIIYYAWGEHPLGDCTGWADHVGIVVGTAWPFIKVIEGNFYGRVDVHYVLMDDVTIRGYALPDYAAACKE